MKNLKFAVLISIFAVALAAQAMAVDPPRSVEAEYKRLIALRDKLAKIPMEKLDREPNKSFIKRNKKDIVYSDPAGEWFVRADRFWDLAKKNRTHPLADDIAWTAAETPLPGECEGYLNCYVYNANATIGEYMRMFPAGKHRKQALKDFAEWIDPLVTDTETYNGPKEASDKRELRKMIVELKNTLARVAGSESSTSMLDKLAERYK